MPARIAGVTRLAMNCPLDERGVDFTLAWMNMRPCYHPRHGIIAHMILHAPLDITGDGSAHRLSDIPGLTINKCKWFQFLGLTIANSGIPGRLGDANVSLDVVSPLTSGRGIDIPAGGGQFCPPIAVAMEFYDLTEIWYILAIGDKAQFAAGA